MATTKLHSIKSTLIKSIEYIENTNKTREGTFITSSFGKTEPSEVVKFFNETRGLGTGRSTILAHHLIQSFEPGEITPENAHLVGIELCQKLLNNEYHYILATHTDHAHIHNHIIVCNTNFLTGKTFETEFNQGKKSERAWARLRAISDEICKAHNLSVVEEKENVDKGISHYEWELNQQNLSWKAQLRLKLDDIIFESEDFEDFLKKCQLNNIETDYNPNRKISLKFKLYGQQKFTRAKTLGWYYEPDKIIQRINMKKGLIGFKISSNIIDTQQKIYQEISGLRHYADINNIKETSKAINILSNTKHIYNANSLDELIMARVTEKSAMIRDMNKYKAQIDDLKLKIELINKYQQIKPISDELRGLRSFRKAKFEKEHDTDLKAYNKAVRRLKEWYPNGNTPNADYLQKQLDEMNSNFIKIRDEHYKPINAEIIELEKARQTIQDYLGIQEKQKKPATISIKTVKKMAQEIHNQLNKKKTHNKSQELE